MRNAVAIVTVAVALGLAMPAFGRELCTPDGKFTICQWPSVEGCELLDDRQVERFALSAGERHLLTAVMRRVERSAFNLDELAAEFGTDVFVDRAIPGHVFAIWGSREIPGSNARAAVAISARDAVIQLAAIRVPGKYSIRWCRNIE